MTGARKNRVRNIKKGDSRVRLLSMNGGNPLTVSKPRGNPSISLFSPGDLLPRRADVQSPALLSYLPPRVTRAAFTSVAGPVGSVTLASV